MSKDVARTNGDLVQPAVDGFKARLAEVRAWAREHPDEVCVTVAPAVAVMFSTRRHDLSFTEALILSELAYWLGVLAVKEYRAWKTKPAGGPPRLRKVS